MKRWIAALMIGWILSGTVFAQAGITVEQAQTSEVITATVETEREKAPQTVTVKVTDSAGEVNYLTMGQTDSGGKFTFSYNNDGPVGVYHVMAKTSGGLYETDYIKEEPAWPPICVEGEQYTTIGFEAKIQYGAEFSGGAVLTLLDKPQSGRSYQITYQVEAAASGMYQMTAVSTTVNAKYTNDYSVRVNQSEAVDVAKEGKFLADFDSPTFPDTMKRYALGSFFLKKGSNEITFIIDEADIRGDGYFAFYLDSFTLEKLPFSVSGIVPAQSCGVFEKGSPAQFDVKFHTEAPVSVTYDAVISDFWGETAARAAVVCKPGENHAPLVLDGLETGWYRLQLLKAGTQTLEAETTFSVVPPLAERVLGETPFAADFASMVMQDQQQVSELAKTLRYAGIGWVRERYMWSMVQPKAGEYDYTDLDQRAMIFADAGVQVTNTFHDIPAWTSMTNLFDIYNFQKAAAARYNGTVRAWEMYNEQDAGFLDVPADTYAAFLKAAALGVRASGADANVSFGGLCMPVERNLFTSLMLENGVARYSDLYNLHAHTTYSAAADNVINTDLIRSHRELKSRYFGNSPFWITEAGLALPLGEMERPAAEQLRAQARYAVVSTAQSLSTGVSKHFWFIWPGYVENGFEWGTFDQDGNSNPVYAAEAVMTYMLGKGTFQGSLRRDGVEGYVFDAGEHDVLVIWGDGKTSIPLRSSGDVVVTDMMGRSQTVSCTDGTVWINVFQEPCYVSFSGAMPIEDYSPRQYRFTQEKAPYSLAEGVVLQPIFSGQNTSIAKIKGYELPAGEDAELMLTAYNFNEEAVTGRLSGQLEGYTVCMPSDAVWIEPMSCVTVPVVLKPTPGITGDEPCYLKFTGEFDGMETSPAVAAVFSEQGTAPLGLFQNQDQPGAWNVRNITETGTATASADAEGLTFNVSFTGGDRWFYPRLHVAGPEKLADTEGLVFWYRADSGSVSGGTPNVFLYLRDGRSYYLGSLSNIPMAEQWTRIKIPWTGFVQYSGQAGLLDPALISDIAVGGNFTKNRIRYLIRELGYYADPAKEAQRIQISGLQAGALYPGGSLEDVGVTVPAGQKTTVMLTDEVLCSGIEGQTLHLNLSALEKGTYTLRIICQDAQGFRISEYVDFFIDQSAQKSDGSVVITDIQERQGTILVRFWTKTNADFQLLAAGYSKGVLTALCGVPVTAGGQYLYQEAVLPAPESGDTVRVFAWDSLQGMNPYSEVTEIQEWEEQQ